MTTQKKKLEKHCCKEWIRKPYVGYWARLNGLVTETEADTVVGCHANHLWTHPKTGIWRVLLVTFGQSIHSEILHARRVRSICFAKSFLQDLRQHNLRSVFSSIHRGHAYIDGRASVLVVCKLEWATGSSIRIVGWWNWSITRWESIFATHGRNWYSWAVRWWRVQQRRNETSTWL